MALTLEIFLPHESIDEVEDTLELQEFLTQVGDILSVRFGNKAPEEEFVFNLGDLNSFIIIKDRELPDPENFENEDMFLIIPLEEE